MLTYLKHSPSSSEVWSGTQGRNLEAETKTRGHGGELIIGLLLGGLYSLLFLIEPRTACLGVAPSGWILPYQSSVKKMPHRVP